MFTDLPTGELLSWDYLCDNAIAFLTPKLKDSINLSVNMERLCSAAAAIAYYNYILLTAAGSINRTASEFKVGDIFVKNSDSSKEYLLEAQSIKDTFLSEISDLINNHATVFLAVAPEV